MQGAAIPMDQPSPEFEKKVLRDVVKQMTDPEATERSQNIMRRFLMGTGSVLLFASYFMAINDIATTSPPTLSSCDRRWRGTRLWSVS